MRGKLSVRGSSMSGQMPPLTTQSVIRVCVCVRLLRRCDWLTGTHIIMNDWDRLHNRSCLRRRPAGGDWSPRSLCHRNRQNAVDVIITNIPMPTEEEPPEMRGRIEARRLLRTSTNTLRIKRIKRRTGRLLCQQRLDELVKSWPAPTKSARSRKPIVRNRRAPAPNLRRQHSCDRQRTFLRQGGTSARI